MKILKAAVVGLGRIGWQFHIPQILKHEGFELVAVVDPLAERLEEAKATYSVKGYTDYINMLETEKPDLVVIASPTPFHYNQTIAAFKRGIDVFLEKPMVPTLEEADKIIEQMEQTGCKFMVYQPHRVTPELLAAKSIIESGALGPLYMVKRANSLYLRRNDWQSQKKFGGGMLINYGAHYIDQLLYVTSSSKAGKISCSLRKVATLGDADDVVKAVIETCEGVILDMDISLAAALPLPMFTLMGSRGTADLIKKSDGQLVFKMKYYKEEELKDVGLEIGLAAPGRSYRNLEDEIIWYEEELSLADFEPICFYDKCYEYYCLDKAPFVPVAETREVLRIMKECREIAGW